MKFLSRAFGPWPVLCCVLIASTSTLAQAPQKPYQPVHGQAGKDVMWIPTPDTMVGKMLDLAKVTARDYVVDLGSGDGRNVIAAAKRGARALGIEYNPELVELSRRAASSAGVAGIATFVQGDMFETDISQATVMILFLITDNLRRLTPRFLDLRPGTRIVSNTFDIPGWSAEETQELSDCLVWCSAYLYIVPARLAGTWRLAQGELTLEQDFQMLSGTLTTGGQSLPIENGLLRGNEIRFTAGGVSYAGRVNGDSMKGHVKGSPNAAWSATRGRPK